MAEPTLFDEASLALIASGGAGKDGKVYSIKPTTGDGDFTFSRGSNLAATRVGADGLIEKGRENLLLQSNQFDTTWDDSSIITLTSGQQDKDGGTSAWKLAKGAASSFLYQSITTSGVNTFSLYAKADTTNWIMLQVSAIASVRTFFDLSNGVLGSSLSNVINAEIESIGNGWYRCSFTYNGNAGAVRVFPADGNNDTSGTSGSIYIQDAQLEQGLVASDVISTTTTSVSAGILEDTPRLDYSGGASCPSLLLEPSRTNIETLSEYFKGWNAVSNVTRTTNYEGSPEGVDNATRLEFTGNGFLYNGATPAQVNGSTYTMTCYAKRNDSGTQNFGFFKNGSLVVNSVMALTTEWKRFEYTFTATNTSRQGLAGVSGADVSVYGFQIEKDASYPTSYIPNHSGTGSVTRGADSCLDSNVIDADNDFTFYFESTLMPENFTGKYFDNQSNGYLSGYNIAGSNLRHRFSGTNYSFTAPEGVFKYLIRKDSTNMKLYLNGTLEYTITTLPTGTNDLELLGGKVHKTLLFPTALSDDECIELTTI